MQTIDKIQILFSNFKRKYGYAPTFVILPDSCSDSMILGLKVRAGEMLAVGLGQKLLLWSPAYEPEIADKMPVKSWVELLDEYTSDRSVLPALLNSVIDFEQGERNKTKF